MTDETEQFIELERQKSSLEEEARNGDVEAQFKLGELIFQSLSVEQGFPGPKYRINSDEDIEGIFKAVRWYELAAEQEHSGAQVKLAEILSVIGREHFPDGPEEGLKWYLVAAHTGHTGAICVLAGLYTKGIIDVTFGYETKTGVRLENTFERWAKARYWFLKTLDFEIDEPWKELIHDCSSDIINALGNGIGGGVDETLATKIKNRATVLDASIAETMFGPPPTWREGIEDGVDEDDNLTTGYGADEGDYGMADEEAYTRSDIESNYDSWEEYHSDDEVVQDSEKN